MLKIILPFLLVPLASAAVASAVADPAPSGKRDKGDEIICKTTMVTGSLVKKRRTCGSRATWDKHSDAYRKQTEWVISPTNSCDGFGIPGLCNP